VCVLNNRKKLEGIRSFKVLKLNVVRSRISPKKKKETPESKQQVSC